MVLVLGIWLLGRLAVVGCWVDVAVLGGCWLLGCWVGCCCRLLGLLVVGAVVLLVAGAVVGLLGCL